MVDCKARKLRRCVREIRCGAVVVIIKAKDDTIGNPSVDREYELRLVNPAKKTIRSCWEMKSDTGCEMTSARSMPVDSENEEEEYLRL